MSRHGEDVTRIMLYDPHTGRAAGDIEVPNEIIEAARKVERWMREHLCTQLHGLYYDQKPLRAERLLIDFLDTVEHGIKETRVRLRT